LGKTIHKVYFLGNQRRQKAPPTTQNASGDAKCVTEILGGGIRKLGAKFKFGHLILRKVIKAVATRCHILRLKCTKFNYGWGSALDPAEGAHSTPPDSLAGCKGSYF